MQAARSHFNAATLLQGHFDDHVLIRCSRQIERSAGGQQLAVGLIVDHPAERSLAVIARIHPPELIPLVLVDFIENAAPRFHVMPAALRVLPLHHGPQLEVVRRA